MNNLDSLNLEQLKTLYDLLYRFNKFSKPERKALLENLNKKIEEKREEQKNE